MATTRTHLLTLNSYYPLRRLTTKIHQQLENKPDPSLDAFVVNGKSSFRSKLCTTSPTKLISTGSQTSASAYAMYYPNVCIYVDDLFNSLANYVLTLFSPVVIPATP